MEKAARLIGGMLGSAALAFIFIHGIICSYDSERFPIQEVLLIGEAHSLANQVLEETLINHLSLGFFKIKVHEIQQALLSQPWIYQVDIRKEWPNKLVVKFEEHVPAVKWGESGMISTTGEVFFPSGSLESYPDLPLLEGPNVRRSIVWQYYLVMQSILSSQNLKIAKLSLAQRGTWQIKLNNGMMINLGKDDIMPRLKRFVRVYKTHLQSRHESMNYVDLRYTRGLAVGWKSG